MNLSVDYDDTFTRDPIFWGLVIDLAQSRGHKVYCITSRSVRHADEVYDDLEKKLGRDAIMFTAGLPKKAYAYKNNVKIDVWIDDAPFFIDNGIKVDDKITRLWE